MPRLFVVLPPLLAWVGVVFEYSNKYKHKFFLLQYDTIWYIDITHYKTPKKERTAYNNKYPVGGAERKDSLAIGRPFVHIRWLVVVDQLGEDKMIWKKWKWLKNNGKVKISGTSVFVRSCKRVLQVDVDVAQLEDGSFEVIWIIRIWESIFGVIFLCRDWESYLRKAFDDLENLRSHQFLVSALHQSSKLNLERMLKKSACLKCTLFVLCGRAPCKVRLGSR